MMEISIQAGFVHGEDTVASELHTVDEHTIQEQGWEPCEEIMKVVMARAQEFMHPEKATWVTVEWTWKPL